MKKTKHDLYTSFYQCDCDDPKIIAFDTFEAAQREAKKDIRNAVSDKKERKEYLDQFDIDGHVSIDKIVIYAGAIEYRRSQPAPENWILLIEKNVDALSDGEAMADTELFESFEAAENALKLRIAREIEDANLIPEGVIDLQTVPVYKTGEGKARRLLWKSKYLNRRCSVYRQEYSR